MTSQRKQTSESGRGNKKRVRMVLLPPNPTDEELQRFVDFLNGKLENQEEDGKTPADDTAAHD